MTNCRNAALVLALCSACSSSTIQKVGSQYMETKTVGQAGGSVIVTPQDDAALAGTQITIPQNALSGNTTIQIGVTSQAVVTSGALGPVIDFEPSGTTFAVPATVSIPVQLQAGFNPSRVGVKAVESDGTSRDITAVTVANGLATFQVSSFTHFGAHDEGLDTDGGIDGGSCTPDCGGGTCGGSDGCGGTCACPDGGNSDSGVCVPNCGDGTPCGSNDGCGGVCAENCTDGGSSVDSGTCIPSCGADAGCEASDGCGGFCVDQCGDAGDIYDGGCFPDCSPNAECGDPDGCGGTCDHNCNTDGGTVVCDGDGGQAFCGSPSGIPYCANLVTDPNNCGACGTGCSGPASDCVNGSCACSDGGFLCGDPDAGVPNTCRDYLISPDGCADCENICDTGWAASSSCRFGICGCDPGVTHLCGTGGTAGAACVPEGTGCPDGG